MFGKNNYTLSWVCLGFTPYFGCESGICNVPVLTGNYHSKPTLSYQLEPQEA